MNRKEKVFEYIKSDEYIPLKKEELAAVLAVKKEDMPELENILDELCKEGKIFQTKRKRYEYDKRNKIVTGELSCSSYGFFGFVCTEVGDIYVKGERMNNALDGDIVVAAVDSEYDGKAEGHIIKISEHKNKLICGVVKRKKANYFSIYPDNQSLYAHVHVSAENMNGTVVGDRVAVEITEYEPELKGTVIKKLGNSDDVNSLVESLIYSRNVTESFPKDIDLSSTAEYVTEKDREGRRDFTNLLTVTIDGDDARDFDDAVSLEKLESGVFRLWVHIADVTHYVRENSVLDREALKRGTSIYLPDRVIPMLPKKLSNGICSLNPHEERLTLTVIMDISAKGDVISHEIAEGVICSDERMTYTDTAALLENPTSELLEKYRYLLPTLKNMKELSDILRKKREERGSIDFDFPEAKIILGNSGLPEDITLQERLISHEIIEEFMLCTNETVAEYAFWSEIPFVYRVHEPPEFESMREFQKFIALFGLGIKERFTETEPIHPKELSRILKKIKGTAQEHMISVYTLRSLMKAEYKPENLGHFGLAAKYYCHFTSPIRRYPDLAVHRILKAFIKGKSLEKYEAFVKEAAKKSSENERKAQELERDVDELLKTYYMRQYIGYVFEAKISSITDFGIFAELENTVEGLIRVENIKDDYYIFDSETKTLTGRENKKVYKIGDKIDVAVARCDLVSHKIDFIPAEDADMSDIDKLQKREYKQKRERQKKINNAKRRRRK